MLDVLIRNGLIVDGGGGPAWRGDIGIRDGKIARLERELAAPARIVLDATGKVIAPGFIDLHSHADLKVLNDPAGAIKLQQGVTTEIFGNCGFSAAPVEPERLPLLQSYSEPIMGRLAGELTWRSYGEYLAVLQTQRFGHHVGGYVGNGALRIAVKGFAAGPLTRPELEKVKALLDEALSAGALGLSIGLMYVPENFYSLSELVEICGVLKKHRALLVAHLRGEGNSLLRSIREVLDIAEQAEVALHISHLKAAGKNNWGATCAAAIGLLEEARGRGSDVTCDVYPYTAGSSTLTSLLPPWALEGGVGRAIQRAGDPAERRRILAELNHEAADWDNLVYSTGWESVVVSSVGSAANQSLVGKSIAEIALIRGTEPAAAALDLLAEEDGNVAIVFFHMAEDDMIRIMKLPYSLIISDSLYSAGGLPHPRLYGTFPRVFAKYVREQKVLTLEEAVRKVTALPAERLGLRSVGRLEPGYAADITVFDPAAIQDRATYTRPEQFPAGIEWVLVGGAIANQSGTLTGARNGRLLTGR
jgi:N-acyl-D-amino-acid deacylase